MLPTESVRATYPGYNRKCRWLSEPSIHLVFGAIPPLNTTSAMKLKPEGEESGTQATSFSRLLCIVKGTQKKHAWYFGPVEAAPH